MLQFFQLRGGQGAAGGQLPGVEGGDEVAFFKEGSFVKRKLGDPASRARADVDFVHFHGAGKGLAHGGAVDPCPGCRRSQNYEDSELEKFAHDEGFFRFRPEA